MVTRATTDTVSPALERTSLKLRYDNDPELEGDSNGMCPTCEKGPVKPVFVKWSACACGYSLADMEARMRRAAGLRGGPRLPRRFHTQVTGQTPQTPNLHPSQTFEQPVPSHDLDSLSPVTICHSVSSAVPPTVIQCHKLDLWTLANRVSRWVSPVPKRIACSLPVVPGFRTHFWVHELWG